MLCCLAATLVLSLDAPSAAADRVRAEQLARAHRPFEAIALFERIVERDPEDSDARVWIARLDLWIGRTTKAEAEFHAVLLEHPDNMDALVGYGAALIRNGKWKQALALLREAEPRAGDRNSDFLGVLARAYRRSGDDRLALEYYLRAKTIAPRDFDNVTGFEDTTRAYGNTVGVQGSGQQVAGVDTQNGYVAASIRLTPRLRLLGLGRVERSATFSDRLGRAGLEWRVDRATTVAVHVAAGPGNVQLAIEDAGAAVIHYAGVFEVGGGIRTARYATTEYAALSQTFAWDPGARWRFDARFIRSRTRLLDASASSGANSVLVRETWRGWRRVWLNAGVGHGTLSLEDLTAEEIGAAPAKTVVGGLRISLPAPAMLNATWEHTFRPGTPLDRFTVSISRSFP